MPAGRARWRRATGDLARALAELRSSGFALNDQADMTKDIWALMGSVESRSTSIGPWPRATQVSETELNAIDPHAGDTGIDLQAAFRAA